MFYSLEHETNREEETTAKNDVEDVEHRLRVKDIFKKDPHCEAKSYMAVIRRL